MDFVIFLEKSIRVECMENVIKGMNNSASSTSGKGMVQSNIVTGFCLSNQLRQLTYNFLILYIIQF